MLRTFTMGEPTPLYADLHAVADAAYDAITGVLRDGTTPATGVESLHRMPRPDGAGALSVGSSPMLS